MLEMIEKPFEPGSGMRWISKIYGSEGLILQKSILNREVV
jgi:hypothetical protein